MGFYPIDVLIRDARRHGVRVLPIHPNESAWDSTLSQKNTVQMGFRNIQGIRHADVDALILERVEKPFSNIHDFLSRTHFARGVIETLALSDAFICFGLDQRHSFWHSIELRSLFEQKHSPQLSLFQQPLSPPTPAALFQPMSLYEAVIEDYRGTSYSLRGHLMSGIRQENPNLPPLRSTQIKTLRHGAWVKTSGLVLVLQRPPTAKGVAFMTLEDEFGSIDLVFFKKIYEQFESIIRNSRFLIVAGRVERRNQSQSLMVTHVEPLDAGPHLERHRTLSPGEHSTSPLK